jgi:uncharacterized membrane protein YphA (DoxX/SURF4 family)
MLSWLEQDPAWVSGILHWPWFLFAARSALTSSFLFGGLTKLFNFSAAIAEQEHFGLRPILIELGGSVLVLSGYAVWLGAGALGCLTAVAMFKADNFWTKTCQERVTQANTFFEHFGLIGGFVLIAFIHAR